MSSKDAALYGTKPVRKLGGGKAISSSTTLSFTSHLSSLINAPSAPSSRSSTLSRAKPKKDDIFSTHNRNTAKRAKRDVEANTPALAQKHTTNGEALDNGIWERSKRKMEEKARLYAAMKRGDVEDHDERYAVDFDRKWAEKHPNGQGAGEDEDSEQDDEDDIDESTQEEVEYTDEFGRTRVGPPAEAARAERLKRGHAADADSDDRFTARPVAPTNVIYGDTIQHQAFDPDEPISAQMQALAEKRDRSLTPPPDQHFNANAEIRTKGTGFFQFSGDAGERKEQMEALEGERAETERTRKEREGKVEERRRAIEERKAELGRRRGKRKADEFLESLGKEMVGAEQIEEGGDDGSGGEEGMMGRIQAAVEKERDEV